MEVLLARHPSAPDREIARAKNSCSFLLATAGGLLYMAVNQRLIALRRL
jgi:hypothetical protein